MMPLTPLTMAVAPPHVLLTANKTLAQLTEEIGGLMAHALREAPRGTSTHLPAQEVLAVIGLVTVHAHLIAALAHACVALVRKLNAIMREALGATTPVLLQIQI